MDTGSIQKAIGMAKAYGATPLILFGSALETPSQARDLDLACDGVPGWKLYELAARLEEELGTLVDLAPLTPATRFTRRDGCFMKAEVGNAEPVGGGGGEC